VLAAPNEEVFDGIRVSLRTGKPLGTIQFVEVKAQALGLNLNPPPRGPASTGLERCNNNQSKYEKLIHKIDCLATASSCALGFSVLGMSARIL
jgi:hypothetical protein